MPGENDFDAHEANFLNGQQPSGDIHINTREFSFYCGRFDPELLFATDAAAEKMTSSSLSC